MRLTVAAPGGLENLRIDHDAQDMAASPGPGEIRVGLRASSLNYHDYLVCSRAGRVADGRIPLADASGIVLATGPGVAEFAAGDHVVSCFFPDWQDGAAMPSDFQRVPGDGIDGFARSEATLPASWFTRAPAGWTHAEAATITTAGVTAWRALAVNGGLRAGETVLVLGTGGVSIYALQLAKAMGARVIATSSSDEKLARAAALGADHLINYRTIPDWGRRVREITGDRGADHVIEVGGAETLAQSFVSARVGGHIALIGVLAGLRAEVPTALMMTRQLRMQGLIVGSRRHQMDFVAAMEATGIRPVVDRTFPLEDLRDAFLFQEAGRHFGKIAVEI